MSIAAKKKKTSLRGGKRKSATAVAETNSVPKSVQLDFELAKPQGFWVLVVLYLCLLAPAAGIALGVIYASQTTKKNRHFGWLCLGAGLLGMLVQYAQGMDADLSGESLIRPYY